MNFITSALKNYANFNGRARRKEYWFFFLFQFVLAFIAGFIDGMISGKSMDDPTRGPGILYLIVVLGLLIPALAVAVRRMHDVGKSGWFILVPIYNLILALTPGVAGSNEYGPDPKGVQNNSRDILDN